MHFPAREYSLKGYSCAIGHLDCSGLVNECIGDFSLIKAAGRGVFVSNGRKTRPALSGLFVGIQECQRESSPGVDNEFRGESALINEKHSLHTNEDSLNRGLRERHIRLMALGSTIGVGLFLGSASAIKLAGPAILLSYVLGGIAIFIIMRALGEMAVHQPVAGSFSRYAQDHLGPLAGYLTGWNYWFMWVVTCVAEITAVGIYMAVWFPSVPQWIWALMALVAMSAVNLAAVKAYGEFEFWFAMIKVVTIVVMIVAGACMIVFGLGNHGVATGVSNLWKHGGFFPHGGVGMLMALQMVMFAYLGVEMIGVTAGEATNPKKSIPDAINSVFWRILIFYVGALFVILAIYPWNEIGTNGSPFVMTFERLGIKSAQGLSISWC